MRKNWSYFIFAFALLALAACSRGGSAAGSDSSGGTATGTTADTTAPVVSSTSPASGATSVALNTNIAVTFSEPMQTATVTNNGTTTCVGSVQVSTVAANFTSCVNLGTPVASNSNQTFTFTPAANLAASTQYLIRVTTGVKDVAGNSLAEQFTLGTAFTTGTAADTTPPTVSSTTPANAATGIAKNSTIQVVFSEAMSIGTITASTTTSCTGSIQVSNDNFASCIAMTSSTPTASAGNTTFTLTPAANLLSATTYKIRVTTAVQDAAGNAMASVFTTATGFTVRFYHTITINGTNDFTSNETFTTTSSGYTGYLTWDDDYVYIGMNGGDVNSGDGNKWVLAYIDGAGGASAGVQYNTQQPNMPTGFAAKYHVRWKANNTYTNAQIYGTSWTDAGWDFSGDVHQSGNFIEIRIPRADIGSPSTLKIIVNMLNETPFSEGTYAGVPSSSFSDGYDPNYSKYLSCNMTGTSAPDTACTVSP